VGTVTYRGSLPDVTTGQRTKIDNHVQIGQNVTIGKYWNTPASAGWADQKG